MSNIIEQCEKDKITFNANILQLQQEKADYIQIHTAISVGKEKDLKNLQNELQTVRNDLMEGAVRLNEKEELVATLTQKEKDSNYKLSNLEDRKSVV